MLLVCRFDAPAGPSPAADAWHERARRAVALLAAQPGCRSVELACATEARAEWVLVAVFASVAAYRRALSPFDVRTDVVPFLSEARTDAPATFERRTSADAGGVVEHDPVLG
jgi:hypothetical protein